MTPPVAIAAATEIRPGRYPDKLGDAMYFEVLRTFLDQWSIRPQQIGGLLASPSGMSMAAGAAENRSHPQPFLKRVVNRPGCDSCPPVLRSINFSKHQCWSVSRASVSTQ